MTVVKKIDTHDAQYSLPSLLLLFLCFTLPPLESRPLKSSYGVWGKLPRQGMGTGANLMHLSLKR